VNGEDRELLERFHRDAEDFRRFMAESGIRQYMELLRHPGRLFLVNLLSGIATGLGILIGGTFLVALVIWILSQFVTLPLIGDFIAVIVREVQRRVGPP